MTSGKQITLEVNSRQPGKSEARRLRRNREVPAVVYGPKTDNLTFSLTELQASRYSTKEFENEVFVLKSDDSKINNLKVLKKSIVHHKLSRRPIHMDFYALDMTQTVRVNIEIKFEGKAEGVREGGVFNALRRDIEIEALPTEIPDNFIVDITELKLDETLHVSDIKGLENIKVITAKEEAICSIAAVKDEPAAEAAPAEGEAADGAKAEGGDAGGEKKS